MTMESFMVDLMLPATYFLFGLAILAVIGGWVFTSVANPKGLIKTVIAIVGIGIIFLIGYSLATGQEHLVKSGADTKTIDAGTSKWIGGALITFYVLFAAAIISIIYSEVSKLFK
ncbi:MAG: hypothetical protein ACPGJS_04585 [Flammeovirgaceae bacterium]